MHSKDEVLKNARASYNSGDTARMLNSLAEIVSVVPQVKPVFDMITSLPENERKAALKEVLEGFLG